MRIDLGGVVVFGEVAGDVGQVTETLDGFHVALVLVELVALVVILVGPAVVEVDVGVTEMPPHGIRDQAVVGRSLDDGGTDETGFFIDEPDEVAGYLDLVQVGCRESEGLGDIHRCDAGAGTRDADGGGHERAGHGEVFDALGNVTVDAGGDIILGRIDDRPG